MVTNDLIEYIVNSNFKDFPEKVIDKAKMCLLDSLGCALGGSKTIIGNKILNFINYLGGKKESTVIGSSQITSSSLAAFANAELANALDFDDCYYWHPGAVIIPTAISVGEALHSTGKELLTAIISGYEVITRISSAMYSADRAPTRKVAGDVWQIFGAVAVAGKLYRLDVEELAMSMGIAGSAAPVPSDLKNAMNPLNKEFGMGMVKNNYGHMSELGVRASILAKIGYTGSRDIFKGDTGFWKMIGLDRCDFDEITAKLGSEYKILDIAFKPYSCCRIIHPHIDAALKIVKEHDLNVDSIERIDVGTIKHRENSPMDDYEPKTIGSAIHSIPYSIACALKGIEPGPTWFKEETLRDQNILSLSKKIRLFTDDKYKKYIKIGGKYYSHLKISSNGKIYEEIITCAKGDPKNPMTKKELKNKFNNLSINVIGKQKSLKIINIIDQIERIKNISDLNKLLRTNK